jgi:hypothetical protein
MGREREGESYEHKQSDAHLEILYRLKALAPTSE